MKRNLMWSLFATIGVAVVSLGATFATGSRPLLGLDLKGGVSVVLQPQGTVDAGTLQQAVSIIQRRVDGLGVANSQIQRQGQDVVINLPGIKNSQDALKVLGQTAELFFRPVYCEIPPLAAPAPTPTTTTPATPTTRTTPTSAPKALAPLGAIGAAELVVASRAVSAPTTSPPATSPPGTSPPGTSPPGASPPGTSPPGTSGANPSTTAPATTIVTPSPAGPAAPLNGPLSAADCQASNAASLPTTSVTADDPSATVILPSYDNSIRYILGPADMKGDVVHSTTVIAPSGGAGYQVQVNFTGAGGDQFDRIAAQRFQYFNKNAATPDPRNLEAIELDGVVESAPEIQASTFNGVAVISGSSAAPFTGKQSSDLALELRYGSLPVRFTPQSVQTVSATIGKDSLKAGLLAGLGGLVLVMLYMILYYRGLGLVVLIGLGVGGSILYSLLTLLSQTRGLALTLSGVTGIIVSIGITVDSYVVYFERLKDEVRAGRSVRQSVERSFARAFRTVLTADFVSFLAALILYLLTVGDVRGFAFTLGLSTLLDVATAYFFIRPMVILVGRRRSFTDGRILGVARGLGATVAPARSGAR
ncbi:MAG: protein translocase subunit SecD [Acidimicrobiales bacterium]